MAEPQISDNTREHRFELSLEGKPAAWAVYELQGDSIRFTHTEVLPEHEGKGLGSRLAAFALSDVKKRGLKAELQCPFIAGYAKKHPEYGF